MSTHNIHLHGEIRKMLCGYPLLSVAMPEEIVQLQRMIWSLTVSTCLADNYFAQYHSNNKCQKTHFWT